MVHAISRDDKIYIQDARTGTQRLATIDEMATIETLTILGPQFASYFASSLPALKKVEFGPDPIVLHPFALSKSGLEHVDFPENVSIYPWPGILCNCTHLRSVSFPAKSIRIPIETCQNAVNLTSVKFNSSIQYLHDDCFNGCKSLILDIPESVIEIGANALCGTANREITIPNACRYVSNRAFGGMRNLERVVIKNPSTIIEPDAFIRCNKLKSIQIGDKTYPVLHKNSLVLPILKQECVHGIDVTTLLYHIGCPTPKKYLAQLGRRTCLASIKSDAVNTLRRRAMQENFAKQRISPEIRLDYSLQELYCLQSQMILPDGIPAHKNFITNMDCDKCQKQYPTVYHECMHRYGFDKKQR